MELTPERLAGRPGSEGHDPTDYPTGCSAGSRDDWLGSYITIIPADGALAWVADLTRKHNQSHMNLYVFILWVDERLGVSGAGGRGRE